MQVTHAIRAPKRRNPIHGGMINIYYREPIVSPGSRDGGWTSRVPDRRNREGSREKSRSSVSRHDRVRLTKRLNGLNGAGTPRAKQNEKRKSRVRWRPGEKQNEKKQNAIGPKASACTVHGGADGGR